MQAPQAAIRSTTIDTTVESTSLDSEHASPLGAIQQSEASGAPNISLDPMNSPSSAPQGFIRGIGKIVYSGYSPTYQDKSGFAAMMPNPEVIENSALKKYIHRMGDGTAHEIRIPKALDLLYRSMQNRPVSGQELDIEVEGLSKTDIEEAYVASMKTQRMGTSVSDVYINIPSDQSAEELVQYLLAQGFEPGFARNEQGELTSVRFHQHAPLELHFGQTTGPGNPSALVDSVDHMVFSVNELEKNSHGKSSLDLWQILFNQHFWGNNQSKTFSEAIEAEGVGMQTQVNHNSGEQPTVVFPEVHSIDVEQLTVKKLLNDEYVPAYIKQAVLTNQVSRGMHSFNDLLFNGSSNEIMGFVQHIAMKVAQDLPTTLEGLAAEGAPLTPRPDDQYYTSSSKKLIQRPLFPMLLKSLTGVDVFSDMKRDQFHAEVFNALFYPNESKPEQISMLLQRNGIEPASIERFLSAFGAIQPVLQEVAAQFPEGFDASAQQAARELIQQSLEANDFVVSQELGTALDTLVNEHFGRIREAQDSGYLIDYENRSLAETGYFVQKFTAPSAIAYEQTVGHFNEFIQRCAGMDEQESSSHCGAFGQGNFKSLMESQQRGIREAEQKAKAAAEQQSTAGASDRLMTFPRASLELMLKEGVAHAQLKDYVSTLPEDATVGVTAGMRQLVQLQQLAQREEIPARLAAVSVVDSAVEAKLQNAA